MNVPDEEKWNLGGLEIQLVERWCFDIGAEERRQICIEKERERLFAAFRPQTYRIYVDREMIQTQRGY